MEKYKNAGGNSGIEAYEIGPDSVTVRFTDGVSYCYTTDSAGEENISEMKELAVLGSGLNSFIMHNCKHDYERRSRR